MKASLTRLTVAATGLIGMLVSPVAMADPPPPRVGATVQVQVGGAYQPAPPRPVVVVRQAPPAREVQVVVPPPVQRQVVVVRPAPPVREVVVVQQPAPPTPVYVQERHGKDERKWEKHMEKEERKAEHEEEKAERKGEKRWHHQHGGRDE